MWIDHYLCGAPVPQGMTKSKLNRWQNHLEFQNWFQYLFSLAWDRFGYRNLEPTVSPRNIERSCIVNGIGGIARPDKEIRLKSGSVIPAGTPISPVFARGAYVNMYMDPLSGWGYGADGFNREFRFWVPGADEGLSLSSQAPTAVLSSAPEAVVGYEKENRYPLLPYIIVAAQRISNLMRACDVAVNNLKSPLIIRADETQKKTIEDMLRRREQNDVSIVYLSNSISSDMFQIFPFDMDHQVLTEFRNQLNLVIADFLEKIGYNSNTQSDKRERLLVDEVNANNDVVWASLMDAYHQRKLMIDRCNALWGTNYEVYIRGFAPSGMDDLEGKDGEGVSFEFEGSDMDDVDDTEGMAGGQSDGGPVPRDGDRRGEPGGDS